MLEPWRFVVLAAVVWATATGCQWAAVALE